MIIFDAGASRFNYRVAGVCLHRRHVLLHRADHDDFWTVPGGHPEALEPSRDALAREWQEELGLEPRVGRLLWIVENFFEFAGRSRHELVLYFDVALPGGSGYFDLLREFTRPSGLEYDLVFRWISLDRLGDLRLYPTFLRTMLTDPPSAPVHVVQTGDHWVLPSA